MELQRAPICRKFPILSIFPLSKGGQKRMSSDLGWNVHLGFSEVDCFTSTLRFNCLLLAGKGWKGDSPPPFIHSTTFSLTQRPKFKRTYPIMRSIRHTLWQSGLYQYSASPPR